MTASKQKKKAAATLIIGTCLLATLLFDGPTEQQVSLRRSLQQDVGESSVPVDDSQGIYPWAKENLYPLNVIPEPQKDYFMFWHIPKVRLYTVLICRSQFISQSLNTPCLQIIMIRVVVLHQKLYSDVFVWIYGNVRVKLMPLR